MAGDDSERRLPSRRRCDVAVTLTLTVSLSVSWTRKVSLELEGGRFEIAVVEDAGRARHDETDDEGREGGPRSPHLDAEGRGKDRQRERCGCSCPDFTKSE